MPEGGTLGIAARRKLRPSSLADQLAGGEYLYISVADTGMGMDAATLARATEPFSTKGIGKGTGLGLSMAQGLAAQLGGALTLNSELGAGTVVEIWLPLAAGPPAGVPATLADPVSRRSGSALLVDDEDLVRASTLEMLTELGYSVIEADFAEAALALVDKGLEPDLLVTDHLMPGMTGIELVERLRERQPRLPALVVSGYAESEGLGSEFSRLTKPFRQSELAEALAAIVVGDEP